MRQFRHSGRAWIALLAAAPLVLVVPAVLVAPQSVSAQASFPISARLPAEARQFDFWVGTWDVNLRVIQEDLTWRDARRSVARIYPILSGKAVLELWSENIESGIKGFSLRYFDDIHGEWVLWLNWPGANRSGSSSLTGSFRHGRGDFFSKGTNAQGEEVISRYSFNDVTPTSLRWDDAYSSDGGKTWNNNWIMEFSRTSDKPVLAPEGGPEHTYDSGSRCDLEQFRRYEFLTGMRQGEVEVGGEGPVVHTGYGILGGCAVLTFVGSDADPERSWAFSHITWNTRAERFELMTLTAGADTPVRMFYSAEGSDELVFYERVEEGATADRFRIEESGAGGVLWVHETPDGDGWRGVWQARFSG